MSNLLYIAFLGGLLWSSQIKAQIVLEALDAPEKKTCPLPVGYTFVPNEKCLELVCDKNFGDGDHDFIYCAVQGPNGKKWLSHNLGAEYTNTKSPHFDPKHEPNEYYDWKAFGSLFQEGRKADGHELVTYYHRTVKPGFINELGLTIDQFQRGLSDHWLVYRKYPITHIKQDVFNSNNSFVYDYANQLLSEDDWATTNAHDQDLWIGQMFNNPCPEGYRIMNSDDLRLILVNDISKVGTDTQQGKFTTSLFFNYDYNIYIVTPPITLNRPGSLFDNTFTPEQLRLQETASAFKDIDVFTGTSSIWLTSEITTNPQQQTYRWNKYQQPYGWRFDTPRLDIKTRITSILDRGVYGTSSYGDEYGYHSINYPNTAKKQARLSMAIRCVEK